MFPPSPMVMYTGAEASFIGVPKLFVMLYLVFDILSCTEKQELHFVNI